MKIINKDLDKYIDLSQDSMSKLESIRAYLDTVVAKGDKHSKNDLVKIHETDKSGIMLQCTSRRSAILKQQIQSGKHIVQLQFTNNAGIVELFDFIPDVHTSIASGSNVNIINETITKICNDISESKQKMKDLITIIYNKFIHDLQNYSNEFLNLVYGTALFK